MFSYIILIECDIILVRINNDKIKPFLVDFDVIIDFIQT